MARARPNLIDGARGIIGVQSQLAPECDMLRPFELSSLQTEHRVERLGQLLQTVFSADYPQN